MAAGPLTPNTTSPLALSATRDMNKMARRWTAPPNMSEEPEAIRPALPLLPSLGRRPTEGSLLLVLLRGNFPVVGAGLGRHRSGGTRRGELRNDFVDMTAAIADHKQDVYDTGRRPCDHHAARAVRTDPIGPRLLSLHRELGRGAVAEVITLCEIAVAVENLDP